MKKFRKIMAVVLTYFVIVVLFFIGISGYIVTFTEIEPRSAGMWSLYAAGALSLLLFILGVYCEYFDTNKS